MEEKMYATAPAKKRKLLLFLFSVLLAACAALGVACFGFSSGPVGASAVTSDGTYTDTSFSMIFVGYYEGNTGDAYGFFTANDLLVVDGGTEDSAYYIPGSAQESGLYLVTAKDYLSFTVSSGYGGYDIEAIYNNATPSTSASGITITTYDFFGNRLASRNVKTQNDYSDSFYYEVSYRMGDLYMESVTVMLSNIPQDGGYAKIENFLAYNVPLYIMSAKVLEVPEVETDLVYNGNSQSFTSTDVSELSLSGTVGATNAGAYTVSANLNGYCTCSVRNGFYFYQNSDYEYVPLGFCVWSDGAKMGSRSFQWSIAKADYDMSEVAWTADSSFVYDGNEKSVALAGFPKDVGGNAISAVYSGDTAATAAGTYTASVTGFDYDTTNYNEPVYDTPLTWTIEKAEYDTSGISWGVSSYTYTGSAQQVTASGTIRGVNGEVLSIARYENNIATNAGEYTAKAVFDYDTTNYNEPIVTNTWTIARVSRTIEIANQTATYSGGEPTVSSVAGTDYAFSSEQGFLGNDTWSAISVTLTKAAGVNAGSYAITGIYTSTNYAVMFVDGTYTIEAKKIATDTLIEESELTYNGGVQSPTIATSEDYSISGNSATNAGTYYATLTLTDKANTIWADTQSSDDRQVEWTIAKATVNVTPNTDTQTTLWTNGTLPALVLNGEAQSLGTIAWNAYTLSAGTNVTYGWTFTPNDPDNYNAATGTVTFREIREDAPESVAITAAPSKTSYAAFETLETAGLTVTVRYASGASRVPAESELTFIYENGDSFRAGDTKVTVSFGGLTAEITVTVGKAQLDMSGVSFEDVTVTYDGQAHGITVSGLPAGVTATYEGNGRTEAGEYTVTARFTADDENYEPTVTELTAKLTISAQGAEQPGETEGGNGNTGLVVGLVVGGAAVVGLAVAAIVVIRKRKARK